MHASGIIVENGINKRRGPISTTKLTAKKYKTERRSGVAKNNRRSNSITVEPMGDPLVSRGKNAKTKYEDPHSPKYAIANIPKLMRPEPTLLLVGVTLLKG